MFRFTQSDATAARRNVVFYAASITDGYTAVTTGITSPTITIYKNGTGTAVTPVSPSVTHLVNGLWSYQLAQSDIDTTGMLSVTIAHASIRTVHLVGYVYSGDAFNAPTVTQTGYLDAAITSRMASYAQPAGFLTATFPGGTIANTTNITAGTITTATSVTNAVTVGTINNNVITAASIAADAIQATKIQDGALAIGSASGTGVKAYLAANAIAAGNIAADALQASKFQDSALVIGNAAAGGVKAYLAANAVNATVLANDAITSAKIATGAIDADAIASDAITAAKIATGAIDADAIAADAITAAKIATGAIDADSIAADAITSAKIADSAITIRMSGDGTPSEGRIIAGSIASDVWNALYASYNTANTFGKLMDTLRKANNVVEGTVTAGSTTTVINTNLTGFTADAFKEQTLHFISGTLTGTSDLILVNSVGGGTITLDEPLSSAPAAGVEFVILATHVHTRESIADGILARDLGSGTNAGTLNERTVRSALRAIRNRTSITASTLTVTKENDDLTPANAAWTAAVDLMR